MQKLHDQSSLKNIIDEINQRKNKRLHRVDWDLHVQELRDGEFKRRQNMSMHKFTFLLKELQDVYQFFRPVDTKGKVLHRSLYGCDPIDPRHKLAVALRFKAGGSYLDIRLVHGVTIKTLHDCVWAAVDGINAAPKLQVLLITLKI